MMCIKRPPLAAENTGSPERNGGATRVVATQPIVGGGRADSSMRGEMSEGAET
jgi:hypothetical protein